MKISGIQKLTLLDFPGRTACTVFLSGCNMRCPFCHNSDLVFGKAPQISSDELYSLLEKRRGVLDGVCITGGEPLLYENTEELIREIKRRGFLVKLDTNGTKPELLEKLLNNKLLDYVAMDIKSSPEGYANAVGIENFDMTPIRRSIDLLKNSGIEYEFRTTAVKQLHGEKEFKGIADLVKGADKFFIQKFKDSGNILGHFTGKMLFMDPPGEEDIRLFSDIVSEVVSFVGIRG
ncbi:MAG: anaerobic ribonucleoside-triphosphate reductase activating protein [Ruminococcaceae bacterium]|nr:anaerobic ribonucleoside-triphosphate reductase activating protein [Oscillospiraceae bacterium]